MAPDRLWLTGMMVCIYFLDKEFPAVRIYTACGIVPGWTAVGLEPEAVVKGPSASDPIGDKSFDPFAASAVISQGNVILVTWRTDPGLNANGVWYSYKVLDIPASPVTPPPPRSLSDPASISVPTSASSLLNDGSTQAPGTDPTLSVDPYSPSVGLTVNTLMAIGVVPVIILVLAIVMIKIRSNRFS
jgi:hypothetical protein